VFGLHRRGQRNAANLQVKYHEVVSRRLPAAFDGFTLLHLSDLHLDLNPALTHTLIRRLGGLDYDLCVITGDFRARSLGPHRNALAEMERVAAHLRKPVYSVLGNHDYIEMVPELEKMGVHVLLNESNAIRLDGSAIYVAGIDDPHFYELHNLQKAAEGIPGEAFSVLLSHSPRVYKWAALERFDLMLCGHTHGGQVCLPGGRALLYQGRCPRRMGAGAWRFGHLQGYTSVGSGAAVVDVRYNCPPEITLHRLHAVG